MSSHITRQRSREGSGEARDLETQPNSTVDSVMDDNKPSFCLNEEQRKMKSFHERKTDVDSAIEWIVKEIVSNDLFLNIRLKDNPVMLVKEKSGNT